MENPNTPPNDASNARESELIKRQKRDPEDIFDEITTKWLRSVGKFTWPVAERVFKLAAWMFVCAAVAAIGQETGKIEIQLLAGVLTVLWIAAALASAFVAVGFLQDAARDRWLNGREEHSGKTLIIDLVITALTVLPMIQVFLSAFTVAVTVMAYIIENGQT